MKRTRLFIIAATAVAVQGFGICSSNAQELYPAYVSAISISTNSSTGNLTYHYFRNRDIIRDCANETGVTNLEGLKLVYDRTADALEVVSGTNQTVLCTPLTFSGGTSLRNTNGTVTQRLAFVYWENSTVANGTMVAMEKRYTPTNGMTYFNLRGQLQLALPGTGTNGPAIYLGSLVAGSNLFDDFDRDGDR
jgi:hypothetical protein